MGLIRELRDLGGLPVESVKGLRRPKEVRGVDYNSERGIRFLRSSGIIPVGCYEETGGSSEPTTLASWNQTSVGRNVVRTMSYDQF